jgi:hypothetical protein
MTDPNSQRLACVLCGENEAKMSLEHIYGDWMAVEFPEQERRRQRTIRYLDPDSGEAVNVSRTETEYRHQTKLRVLCQDSCNGKWGSQLEDAVRPLLLPLIRGENYQRSREQVAIMATWAAKVAVLLEYMDKPGTRMIPQEHKFHLRQHSEPPPRMVIWAGGLVPGATWSSRTWRRFAMSHVAGSPTPDRVAYDTYISTFGFGRFFFGVGGNFSGAELTHPADVVPEALVRIWPDPRPFFWPRERALTDPQVDHLTMSIDALINPPDAYPYIPAPPNRSTRRAQRRGRPRT